jgi:predicted PurR-regulated permease PerM
VALGDKVNLGQWIGLIVIAISAYVLWQIRDVLILVFAAIVIATILNRLAKFLQRWVKVRAIAVLLSLLGLIAVIALLFWLIVPGFASEFRQLGDALPVALSKFQSRIEELRHDPQFGTYIPEIKSINQQLLNLAQRLPSQFSSFISFFFSSLGALLNFLLVIVLTLMLLFNPQPYRRAFLRLFPSFYRRRAEAILSLCEESLGKWIVGALIGMSVIGVLSWLGLGLLGVKLALANGILAGLLNFIPNVGPTLSVVLPVIITVLDSPLKALGVVLLYVGIQQFESNLLTPTIMAQQVSLLPAITLSAQILFTTAFGPLGLVLSIPLTVVAQIWFKEVLIKDVLDKWDWGRKTETEVVIIKDKYTPSKPSETEEIESYPESPEEERS